MVMSKYQYFVITLSISIVFGSLLFMGTAQINTNSSENTLQITTTINTNVPMYVNATYNNQLLNLTSNSTSVPQYQNVLLIYMVKNGTQTNDFLEIKGNSIQLTWNVSSGPYFKYVTNNGTYSFYTYSLKMTGVYSTIFTTCYTNMSNIIWEGVNHTIFSGPPLQSLYLRMIGIQWTGPYRFGSYSYFNYTLTNSIWNPLNTRIQFNESNFSCPFLVQPEFKNGSQMTYNLTFGSFCISKTTASSIIIDAGLTSYSFNGFIQLINYSTNSLPAGNYSFRYVNINQAYNYFFYNFSFNIFLNSSIKYHFDTIPSNWGSVSYPYVPLPSLYSQINSYSSLTGGIPGLQSNGWAFANLSRWNVTSTISTPFGLPVLKDRNNAGKYGVMYDSVQYQRSFSDGSIEGWLYSADTNFKMPTFWIRTSAQTTPKQTCTFLGSPSYICSGYALRFYNDSVSLAIATSNGGFILQSYYLGQYIGNTWWHVKLQAKGQYIIAWVTTSNTFNSVPTLYVYNIIYSSGYAALSAQTNFTSGSYYDYFSGLKITNNDPPIISTSTIIPSFTYPIQPTQPFTSPYTSNSGASLSLLLLFAFIIVVIIGAIVVSKNRSNNSSRGTAYSSNNLNTRNPNFYRAASTTQTSRSPYGINTTRTCLHCGQSVEIEDVFCSNCGQRL